MTPPRIVLDVLRCRRASVAIEAALILPLACLIMLGCYETYSFIRTVALIERAAYSIGDIMSRQTAQLIDCNNTSNPLNLRVYIEAAEKIVSPLSLDGKGEVILTGISTLSGATKATVSWQRRSDYTVAGAASVVGKQGGTAALPNDLLTPTAGTGDTLIVTELFYTFTPYAMTSGFWANAPGTITISRRAYTRARTQRQDLLGATQGCPALATL